MRRFISFFSLATGTQLALLANQLLLLPLQLHVWGEALTAHWFVIIAIANLATIADLGMRNAGHADLLSATIGKSAAAKARFAPVWALTRLLSMGVTAALVAAQIWSDVAFGRPVLPWAPAIIVSLALDTLVIVRGVWLESLGHFNRVETVFFLMVATRVLLSAVALAVFRAPPEFLGWILLATAFGGAAGQAFALRDPDILSFFAGGWLTIRPSTLTTIPLAVSDPAVSWIRLSLPVIVLAAIASPAVLTTYVALRAIFGMSQQVTSQIARFASVTYVHRVAHDNAAARQVAALAVSASTIFGAGVAGGVIADHGRLLGLWLVGADPDIVSLVAASFAVTVSAFGYQVVYGVMIRSGDMIGIAKRNYVYIVTSLVAAAIMMRLGSMLIYLVFIALGEALIAALFVGRLGPRIRRTALAAFASAVLSLAVLWILVSTNTFGIFRTLSVSDELLALAIGLFPPVTVLATTALVDLPAFAALLPAHWRRAGSNGLHELR